MTSYHRLDLLIVVPLEVITFTAASAQRIRTKYSVGSLMIPESEASDVYLTGGSHCDCAILPTGRTDWDDCSHVLSGGCEVKAPA
jgi:hypothetical protein